MNLTQARVELGTFMNDRILNEIGLEDTAFILMEVTANFYYFLVSENPKAGANFSDWAKETYEEVVRIHGDLEKVTH